MVVMKIKITGFTLVELIISILIMGILATFAAPSFNKILAKQQLNADVRSLTSVLMKTRHQAIFLRKETKLNFVSGTSDDTNFYWQANYKTQVATPTVLTPITFRKDGGLQAAAADMTFKVCSTKIQTSKNFILTKNGSIFYLADGTCT